MKVSGSPIASYFVTATEIGEIKDGGIIACRSTMTSLPEAQNWALAQAGRPSQVALRSADVGNTMPPKLLCLCSTLIVAMLATVSSLFAQDAGQQGLQGAGPSRSLEADAQTKNHAPLSLLITLEGMQNRRGLERYKADLGFEASSVVLNLNTEIWKVPRDRLPHVF